MVLAKKRDYFELLTELIEDLVKETRDNTLTWYSVAYHRTYFAFRGQIPYALHRETSDQYFYIGGQEVAVNVECVDELARAIYFQLRGRRRQLEGDSSVDALRRAMLEAGWRQARRR